MSEMIDTFDKVKYDEGDENMIHNEFSSIVYDELIIEIKTIWDSRTMNALHDFYSFRAFKQAIFANNPAQPKGTRLSFVC